MNKIIKGTSIVSISPIVAYGRWNMYFRMYVHNPTGGMKEYRIHHLELQEAISNLNFIEVEPKGNRKYPYLKVNSL